MFELFSGPPIVDDAGWLPLVDDELALASRLPVVARGMLTFADAAGEDRLAAKGVLHARLARSPGASDVLDVFTTHLQAGREQAEVRRRQVEELAAFVAPHGERGGPVLVLGDLNIWGGTPDRADPASEYNHLMQALNAAVAPRRFVDLWLATHPRRSGDRQRHQAARARGRRAAPAREADRLSSSRRRGARAPARHAPRLPAEHLVVDGEPVGDLSNHAALLAEIAWRPRADPLTAAADERQLAAVVAAQELVRELAARPILGQRRGDCARPAGRSRPHPGSRPPAPAPA